MADKRVEKKIKQAEKKEVKLINYLIRDFYEIKILLKLVLEAEKVKAAGNQKELKSKIEKIIKKMRGGIFGSEERIEYRMARCFKQMEHLVMDLEPILAKVFPGEVKEINTLLKEGEVYNADLEKLGARGGEIESELRKAFKNPSRLDEALKAIQQSFKDIQAFERIINQLLDKTKMILAKIDKLSSFDPNGEHLGKIDINIQTLKIKAFFDSNEITSFYRVYFELEGTIQGRPFTCSSSDLDGTDINADHYQFSSAHQFFDYLANEEMTLFVLEKNKKRRDFFFEEKTKLASMIFYVLQSDSKWEGQLEKFFEALEVIQARIGNRNKTGRGVVGRRIKFR